MAIKAIATEYDGYRFRSQLEARWALFFNRIIVPYIYELDGYKLKDGAIWYRPDFWLPAHRCYVEIKPYSPSKAELDKAYYLSLESEKSVWIMCGDPYGLLEVHQYQYILMTEDVWHITRKIMDLWPDFINNVEHISESGMIIYDMGDMLHYTTWIDPDSVEHMTEPEDCKPLILFHVGHRTPDLDVVWSKMGSLFELAPELSALVPDEARKARLHQFWKPRDR